ncbi:MAG: bifunctional phosphoglucose/phosphomannose isomerase [Candidatus Rehaiarchaeum fermentans]|nr:bifunctional phosphoglucose/phosphomannose isomerase [Candidatus Rehaiarchaeum fermentans]
MEYIEEIRQFKEQIKFSEDKKFDVNLESFKNIVISGMGGSGIVGNIVKDLYSNKPVVVINDYNIPNFVDNSTLFVAVSYSGNTEETISSTEQAIKKGAKVLAITSGGKLKEIVKDSIIIPSSFQPRAALGYMAIPILNTLGVSDKNQLNELYELLSELDSNHDEFDNIAKEIFEGKKIPVIYGVPPYFSVSYRWKTQFNENAKVIAYSSNFSELNHNDTMALKETYRKRLFYFICLHDGLDQRIEKRISITQNLTKVNFKLIKAKGSTFFVREFYLIHVGDWVTYSLALLRNKDPENVRLIEKLKKELEKS